MLPPMTASFELRTVEPEEITTFVRVNKTAFGFVATQELEELERLVLELDRTVVAVDAGSIVATAGVFSFDVSVAGGTVPMAGVTWIGVLPSHRRQGILRAMMRRMIDEARERGEPLAGLWASEGAIYGRFGFAPATYGAMLEVDRRGPVQVERLPAAAGRTSLVSATDAREPMLAVYEAARRSRAGMPSRNAMWLDHELLADPEGEREGGGAKQFALYRVGRDVRGYLVYRLLPKWDDHFLSHGTMRVFELMALDTDGYAGLWTYCLGVDLVEKVVAWNRPVDDPLPLWLADPRRARVTVGDAQWLAFVDLARALAGRGYATEDRLVLRVHDAHCPDNDGTWAVQVAPDGSECTATTDEPDLVMEARDLAAAYLGGVPVRRLALAGRIAEHTPDAVARLDAALRVPLAPWTPEVY